MKLAQSKFAAGFFGLLTMFSSASGFAETDHDLNDVFKSRSILQQPDPLKEQLRQAQLRHTGKPITDLKGFYASLKAVVVGSSIAAGEEGQRETDTAKQAENRAKGAEKLFEILAAAEELDGVNRGNADQEFARLASLFLGCGPEGDATRTARRAARIPLPGVSEPNGVIPLEEFPGSLVRCVGAHLDEDTQKKAHEAFEKAFKDWLDKNRPKPLTPAPTSTPEEEKQDESPKEEQPNSPGPSEPMPAGRGNDSNPNGNGTPPGGNPNENFGPDGGSPGFGEGGGGFDDQGNPGGSGGGGGAQSPTTPPGGGNGGQYQKNNSKPEMGQVPQPQGLPQMAMPDALRDTEILNELRNIPRTDTNISQESIEELVKGTRENDARAKATIENLKGQMAAASTRAQQRRLNNSPGPIQSRLQNGNRTVMGGAGGPRSRLAPSFVNQRQTQADVGSVGLLRPKFRRSGSTTARAATGKRSITRSAPASPTSRPRSETR